MTRISKIEFLNDNGELIEYHYNYYNSQRRLIIDSINAILFKNTIADQKRATSLVDLLYWEYISKA